MQTKKIVRVWVTTVIIPEKEFIKFCDGQLYYFCFLEQNKELTLLNYTETGVFF